MFAIQGNEKIRTGLQRGSQNRRVPWVSQSLQNAPDGLRRRVGSDFQIGMMQKKGDFRKKIRRFARKSLFQLLKHLSRDKQANLARFAQTEQQTRTTFR